MAKSITKVKKGFTSYLDAEVLNGGEDARQANLRPKLITGELEVASARNVQLFTSTANIELDKGTPGLLVVTNFKLSFLSLDTNDCDSTTYQENVFLGKNDVTLSNIDCIYQINDKEKRLINSHNKISSKLDGLFIICKNYRVLKFSFKGSEVDKGRHIAEALVKFAFPNRHNLLFCYNYKENYYNTIRHQVTMFNDRRDWSLELIRCGATGWRVLSIDREDNIPLGSLPMHFVIPKHVNETDYLKLSNCFRNSRSAIWVYSVENASLVRMAELIPTITDTKQENQMLELIRKCDPKMKQPYLMELTKLLPSIQEVYHSYVKLRKLCTPDSIRQFRLQDARFYNLLDKSYWILYVSLCLKYATVAAQKMREATTVVLQENDGRDMSCVISSLTQIILDPHYRTINGFQSLVQKDWIALGHPFSDRLGHVINDETTEQSPLFLLFLDCTWQLLQQFPEEFEFSETFLTTIWDTAFVSIFDTFQFNSEHDREVARQKDYLILRPAWDWGEQFSDKDILLFSNPFYRKPAITESSRRSMAVLPPNAIQLPGLAAAGGGVGVNNSRFTINLSQMRTPSTVVVNQTEDRFLQPQWAIRHLEVWMQCYYRWNPILEIKNGGFAQIDLYNRMLLCNISKLQQSLQSRDFDDVAMMMMNNGDGTTAAAGQNMPSISSFFPFTGNTANSSNELTDVLTASNDILAEGSIFDGLSVSQGND